MDFSDFSLLTPVIPVYKISRLMKMDWLLKNMLLPSDYKEQINELDVHLKGKKVRAHNRLRGKVLKVPP